MKYIPIFEVPLAPLIAKNDEESIQTKRLRPIDSLDLKYLVKELNSSILNTIKINDSLWSVISVISPYSADFHVMLMETSENRYLPSIEYVGDREGNSLMKIWVKIVEYMKEKKENQRILIGYNWSPRSWGDEEEKTGFQSIPTKWHGMFWTWPKNTKKDEKIQHISYDKTDISFKRLNGKNNFGNDMVSQFKIAIDKIKNNHTTLNSYEKKTFSKDGTLHIQFSLSLEKLLEVEEFFSGFLKPIAKYLDDYFTKITEIFIDQGKISKFLNENLENSYNISDSWCEKINNILEKTSNKMISAKEYAFLHALPPLAKDDIIHSLLKQEKFSDPAINELLNLVKNRYSSCLTNAWRKGFAYALTLEEIDENLTEIAITPAAYLGPGGMVETKEVVLKRPEDHKLHNELLKNKSNELYKFAKEYLQ